MPLTSKTIKRVELLHDPPHWIDVRMPSFLMVQKVLSSADDRTLELAAGNNLALLVKLNWMSLLEDCVLAWSYPEPLDGNIAELDVATVRQLIAVLMPEETDDDRKNA